MALAAADYGRMPVHFIANTGQLDEAVDYYVPGRERSVYFSRGGLTIVLEEGGAERSGRNAERRTGPAPEKSGNGGRGLQASRPERGRWAVKLDFLGADPACRPRGEAKGEAVVSYFRGKPGAWKAGVPTYAKVVYSDLWPGIDLVYSGTYDRLKYEFAVRPGADPAAIRLAYRGVDGLSLDPDGRLLVKTPAGSFSDDAPVAYQEIGGRRAEVGLAYALTDGPDEGEPTVPVEPTEVATPAGAQNVGAEPGHDGGSPSAGGGQAVRHSYGFDVGAYNRSRTLVIDPAVFVYCGYIGGSGTESGAGIAVDAAGCAYIAGSTISTETTFPVVVGPDLTLSAGYDAFVAKVKADGTGLVYCGFIGGAGGDYGNGIAVDAAGCAYVAGTTQSYHDSFPVTVGPDLVFGATGTGGYPDAFIAKVNAAGTALAYCGYIGGRDEDKGYAVAVDGAGCAYVTGFTTNDESLDLFFPVLVGPDLTHNGVVDAFVTKVNAAGTGLVYSGFIGGDGSDYGHAIAVDGSGRACVAGVVYSDQTTFPAVVGPDPTFNGGTCDAFVARVGASGAGLEYCGFIGGSAQDIAYGVAVDAAGCAYVAGQTYSTETTSFPVIVGPDLSANGLDDAFVAKVSATGAGLDYCGFVGGNASDQATGIAVDAKGNAYLTGEVRSSESTFPVVSGPDLTHNGTYSDDAFIARVKPGGYGLEYCGYIGGSNADYGTAVAVDAAGNAYVVGVAGPSTTPPFPATGGPDLTFNGGPDDVFVAKVYYLDENLTKHAVGDFDGDGADEAAVDFGPNGVWVWNAGEWGQILPADAENLLAADLNGDGSSEIVADLGMNGLWLWNGAWTGISNSNPETIAPADIDADGADELVVDFGATGLWLWNGGAWSSLSGLNAQGAVALDADGNGGEELAVDFGPAGLWLWNGGAWSPLSGLNPNHFRSGNLDGSAAEDLAAAFDSAGVWLWSGGGWAQVSGARADDLIAGNVDGAVGDEVVVDFGTTGLWLWASGAWTQLSGVNADYVISADTDGDGVAEVLADFGAIGLWLWNAGDWSQLSGANPEFMIAGNLTGPAGDEMIVDFGGLGVWLWDDGAWSQLSALNPD